jgi:membrane protein implicated in regulation of membrane protease activity
MEILLAPETRPFAVAAMVLLGLVGIELLMLLIGVSISDFVEKSFDHDSLGGLNWLNVGGVPLLILIVIALGAFAGLGFAIQSIARAIATPLPAAAAGLAAFALALPVIRSGSRLIARIVPRDESYAVELADLVGRTGEVSRGPLDQGLPGSVHLKDAHGNWHTVRARAADDTVPMATGATVLLVDLRGAVFTAIPAPPDLNV